MNDLVTLSPDAQPSFGSTRHFGSVSESQSPNGCSPWVRPFPPRLPPRVALPLFSRFASVGSEEALNEELCLRPPHKPDVQFSRIRLS
jgi:hypothetical protein